MDGQCTTLEELLHYTTVIPATEKVPIPESSHKVHCVSRLHTIPTPPIQNLCDSVAQNIDHVEITSAKHSCRFSRYTIQLNPDPPRVSP